MTGPDPGPTETLRSGGGGGGGGGGRHEVSAPKIQKDNLIAAGILPIPHMITKLVMANQLPPPPPHSKNASCPSPLHQDVHSVNPLFPVPSNPPLSIPLYKYCLLSPPPAFNLCLSCVPVLPTPMASPGARPVTAPQTLLPISPMNVEGAFTPANNCTVLSYIQTISNMCILFSFCNHF